MEDEQQRRKRMKRTTLDQLEEGRVFPAVQETIESDVSYSDEDEDGDEDFICSDDGGYEFFHIQSGLDDYDFSEVDCEYDYEQEIEEDEIDPDELSYEELIALGEMVGVENTGLSEADIKGHLQPLTCQAATMSVMDRCVICQMEYENGDKLVSLQQCRHLYHRDCISKWLQIKKVCPICNDELQINCSSLE